MTDSECASNTGAGFCEPDGYCSFFDPECESERRYSDLAGGGLAGTCVPVTGTTGSQGSSTGGGSESTSGGGTTETGSVDDGSTLAVGSTGDSSDTTGAATSGGTSTGSSSEGSDGTGDTGTTGTQPVCSLVDDFEDAAIAPMWTLLDPENVSEVGGAIVFDLQPPAGGLTGVRTDLPDIDNSTITAEIGVLPSVDGAQSVFQLRDGADAYAFILLDDQLSLRRLQGGTWDVLADLFWGDAPYGWLRFRSEDGVLAFEASVGGAIFETLYEEPLGSPLGWQVDLAATDFAALTDAVAVSFLHFAVCEL